jgi:hypothetical protein
LRRQASNAATGRKFEEKSSSNACGASGVFVDFGLLARLGEMLHQFTNMLPRYDRIIGAQMGQKRGRQLRNAVHREHPLFGYEALLE